LACPSSDAALTDHVGKEAFINAMNDGPLLLKVMKEEPVNIEAALSCAIKVDAYEQSLVYQGTLTTDGRRTKRRSRTVYVVSVQYDADHRTAVQRRIDELQGMLEKMTICIAALAARSGAADKGATAED